MAECAYCGCRFAEVRNTYQTLVILDGARPDAWEKAEELMAEWQEQGELEREAIVDRRIGEERFAGRDRRLRPSWVPRPLSLV
jgi:hypothetical protein